MVEGIPDYLDPYCTNDFRKEKRQFRPPVVHK